MTPEECRELARKIMRVYDGDGNGTLDSFEIGYMQSDCYRAMNKGFNPTPTDIAAYSRIIDSTPSSIISKGRASAKSPPRTLKPSVSSISEVSSSARTRLCSPSSLPNPKSSVYLIKLLSPFKISRPAPRARRCRSRTRGKRSSRAVAQRMIFPRSNSASPTSVTSHQLAPTEGPLSNTSRTQRAANRRRHSKAR